HHYCLWVTFIVGPGFSQRIGLGCPIFDVAPRGRDYLIVDDLGRRNLLDRRLVDRRDIGDPIRDRRRRNEIEKLERVLRGVETGALGESDDVRPGGEADALWARSVRHDEDAIDPGQ